MSQVQSGEATGIRKRERNRERALLAILLFAMTIMRQTAYAQDASFDASVDKNPVALGDQFTLSFALNNAGIKATAAAIEA